MSETVMKTKYISFVINHKSINVLCIDSPAKSQGSKNRSGIECGEGRYLAF